VCSNFRLFCYTLGSMQFNPTDKSISIIGMIDFLLFGSSATLNTKYAIADRTRETNNSWDEAVAIMFRADPNYKWDDTTNSDLPIATLDLIANQDHYSLLESALVINRVRMFDSQGDFKTLIPVNEVELSDDELKAVGEPTRYYKLSGVVFPVSIPNYGGVGGVELRFQRGANHFSTTDTTAAPGFNPMFHQYLAVGAALVYAIANGMTKKIQVLSAQKTAIADAMREHYQLRSPDEKPKMKLKQKHVSRYGF